MLEDPTYQHIVRWNDAGDSFVVLDVGQILQWNQLPLTTNNTYNTEYRIYKERAPAPFQAQQFR